MTAKVLVVDDDPDIREVLAGALTNRGFQVETAADSSEAEMRVSGVSYDVVVTDLKMPGGDGFELARKLMEGGNQTPIILMTGTPLEEIMDEVISPTIFGYVQKPADLDFLAALVSRAARVSEVRRGARQ